jgi:hypothetical protein
MNGRLNQILTYWLGPSYRTSLAGATVFLSSSVLLFADELGLSPTAQIKIAALVSMISGGGLYVARDDKVSSERAGAK